jgi:two-component system, cell cycle sensor histidine kinase and response regulator CckA
MAEKPTYEELEQRITLLENESTQRKRFEKINLTLFEISSAVNMTSNLDELFRRIHLALSPVIDTTNFYIALYDGINDSVTFPYCIDTVDGVYPPVIEVSKTASLTAQVIRTGRPVMVAKAERLSQLAESSLIIPACTPSEIWLGVPLKTRNEITGVMAVQSYHDPMCYDQTDLDVMVSVADQVAIAVERKRAEEALRESEELYRLSFENVRDVIYSVDTDFKFRSVSPGVKSLLGYEPEELIDKTFMDVNIISSEYLPQAVSNTRRIMSGDQIKTSVYEFIAKGGRRLFGEVSGSPLYQDGKIIGLVSVARDISERKRVEETLQKSEARLNRAELASKSGNWELHLDSQAIIASDGAAKIYGVDKKHLDYAFVKSVPLREYRQLLDDALTKLLADDEPYDVEFKIKTADTGEIKDIHSIALFDREKRILFGIIQDITERKQVDQALRESEERFRRISQLSNDIAYSCFTNRDGVFSLDWMSGNTEKTTGYTIDQINAQSCWRFLVIAEDIPIFEKNIVGLSPGQSASVDLRMRHKNGEIIWVTSYAECATDAKTPESLRIYGGLQDITDRKKTEENQKRLQEQLHQSQKMDSIGRLAGGVAHDFNNMLQVILGYTSMALDNVEANRPLYSALQLIKKSAERSADLTRQLLAFARRQTITPRELDMNETVEGTLVMLRRIIGENIGLTWLPCNDLWTVNVDPSQIDQILVNLCINARDSISGIGQIGIETANSSFDNDDSTSYAYANLMPGEYVMLAVSDNGSGMDKETQANIFEPFFTTKELGKGTGLGLATVYGIIKQNNGYIYVYSDPGQGTTFKIFLPRHVFKEKQIHETLTPEPVAHGHETILLVEDEPELLKMTQMMLENQGYTVLAATTPGEAIRLAEAEIRNIHLVITDVIMPEMNGGDIARKILAIDPSIKQLFMSGHTADFIAHHGVLDPGVNFIQKPFSMKALTVKVREVMNGDHG